jgi:glycerophosphoryl diester phosphodiesterase
MSIVLAHRGASGYAPENTLEAFKLAMEMGADGFELDVHLSADGELIVIHDETVDRTTNGKGYVKDMTLSQLKQLDACKGMEAYRGARIPTLGEVYDLIKDTHHMVNVEIKTDNIFYKDIERKCLELEQEKGMQGRILYSSFNHYTAVELKCLAPDAKVGLLYEEELYHPWEYAKSLDMDAIHPPKKNVYIPGLVEGALAAGIEVNVWTVNDEDTMKECLKYGIGIITNYPDIALRLRDKK